MQDTKLTIRLPRELLENAKRYARQQNTTLTKLVGEYLRHIPASKPMLDNAPLVRRLLGTLSNKVATTEYKKHIEEKYGRKN